MSNAKSGRNACDLYHRVWPLAVDAPNILLRKIRMLRNVNGSREPARSRSDRLEAGLTVRPERLSFEKRAQLQRRRISDLGRTKIRWGRR